MNATTPDLPRKTREIHNNHMDSTIWNEFKFRDDDIIIATYAKSGTTWMQQIVSQLIFKGEEGLNVAEMSPWLELRLPPAQEKLAAVEAQTHRRFIKTHLPVDAFVFNPKVKHLYIGRDGRDGRDAIWSMHHHHLNFTSEVYDILNGIPGLQGPPLTPPTEDPRAYFLEWLDDRGFPVWSFWENVRSWWAIRNLPNVMLVHFNDLKADMESEIRRIAEFLEIAVGESGWPAILEHCSFDYMKAHADGMSPLGGTIFKGGGKTFINKGSNGRWRDRLTTEDSARYEAQVAKEFDVDCAVWLANGERI